NIAKSSVADIYALIDADLQEAAGVLPLSWESKFVGRLTKGAANALQAKTFLYRQNWAGALAAAKQVIASGRYNLNTPFNQIFTEAGENSTESVFEIQAFKSQTQDFGIQYATVQGVRGAGAMDLGWGWNTPNRNLANAFEAGDPRKDATLLYSGIVNQPYGELIPDSTGVVPRPFWNKKVYTNPSVRAVNDDKQGRGVNLRVIRYADVVLMAAEAANELGGAQNTTDALAYLEMVRARARGGNNAVLPKVTTTNQAALRDAIRKERRVELAMEGDRFYDLVRWGIAQQVFQALGKNYQPKNRYLPIPQPEVDKSAGVLKQNPDY
ncbi:MAG TPA: RagB/SusD family nutrient uptake outer membrane protein, partial [Chitinophagaceae bacterium]|nr:RagB/SusD family nutrient uptake outer membrane protein [Chitinophagaceae bacterium]